MLLCWVPEFWSNEGNKHKMTLEWNINSLLTDGAYIVLCLTRHNELVNDDKETIFAHGFVYLTRDLRDAEPLESGFIRGHICRWSCKNSDYVFSICNSTLTFNMFYWYQISFRGTRWSQPMYITNLYSLYTCLYICVSYVCVWQISFFNFFFFFFLGGGGGGGGGAKVSIYLGLW